jgi:hypothetical protein
LKKLSFSSLKKSWSKPAKVDEKIAIPTGEFFNDLRSDWLGVTGKASGVVQTAFQTRLVEFLNKRCLPKSYPFYIAHRGNLKGRIIVPILDGRNNIIYYQARATDPMATQKYMNPDLTSKKTIIMNEHRFDRSKYIVVTEGPLDALCIGDQGTCCFGSSVDDAFLSKLMVLTDMGVIIALDNDLSGMKATRKILDKSRYAKNLLYFTMPWPEVKDINQLVIEHPEGTDPYVFVLNHSRSYLDHVVRTSLN